MRRPRNENSWINAEKLNGMTYRRISIPAVRVVGPVDISEELRVETTSLKHLGQANPPLQVLVAARGFVEQVFPNALELMIRCALDRPIQNQLIDHIGN